MWQHASHSGVIAFIESLLERCPWHVQIILHQHSSIGLQYIKGKCFLLVSLKYINTRLHVGLPHTLLRLSLRVHVLHVCDNAGNMHFRPHVKSFFVKILKEQARLTVTDGRIICTSRGSAGVPFCWVGLVVGVVFLAEGGRVHEDLPAIKSNHLLTTV